MKPTSLIGNEAHLIQQAVFHGEKGNAYKDPGNWLHACFAILLGISDSGIDLAALTFIHEAILPKGSSNPYSHGRDVVNVVNGILNGSTVTFQKRLFWDKNTDKIFWIIPE
jgi:hypothetical protein